MPDISSLTPPALFAFTLLFAFVAVVLPSLRMRARLGHTGFVAHRAPTPVHQVAVEGFRVITVGAVLWPPLLLLLGRDRLAVWTAPPLLQWIGWALAVIGVALVVVAQAQMGSSWRIGIDARERTELVTGGLFRVVRNPIFSAMLLMLLGVVFLTPSPWSICGWLFLLFVLAVQVRLEEQHLERLHGATYREYLSRVGRFVPMLGTVAPERSEVANAR